MAKGLTILAELRRNEHAESLRKLSDRDLCEMVRAHFESHPALPGEKIMKDQANQVLAQLEDVNFMTEAQKAETQRVLSSKFDPDGPAPVDASVYDNGLLSPEEKETLVQNYARTRIRETPLKEGNYYLDFRHFDPTALKRNRVDDLPQNNGASTIYVDRVNVELQNNGAGEVYVLAELSDGGHRTIGTLPDNFMHNNPMNVERCDAELQLADFSNGNMKNLSAKVVVDTDVMSGDVVDLQDDMFAGLDQTDGLQQ